MCSKKISLKLAKSGQLNYENLFSGKTCRVIKMGNTTFKTDPGRRKIFHKLKRLYSSCIKSYESL